MLHIKMTTKELLLATAGELFAKQGYDSVSTRTIADSAGVKLGSIHYHFGSKENLYIEAFKQAKDSDHSTRFKHVVEENPALLQTPEGKAEIIKNTIFRRFHDYFRSDRQSWETQLLVREVTNPSTALPALAQKLLVPESESAIEFYMQVNPDASRSEAQAWADFLYGQMVFYIMTRKSLESVRGETALNNEFLLTAAKMLSKAMILAADLPLPVDLK